MSCQPIPTAAQSSIDDEQGYYGAESQYYASIAPPPVATESQAKADAAPITPCRYARLNCDADMPNKAWDANGKPPAASGCSWNPFDGNSCVGQAAGVVNQAWQHTGGDLVNSVDDAKDWGLQHPGETAGIILAAGVVVVTCVLACGEIVVVGGALAAGDIGLGAACAVACVVASGFIVPILNLGGTLWNASNVDNPDKRIDLDELNTIPYEFTAPDTYIPPTVTNPALRNGKGWFISPKPIWSGSR